MILADVMGQIGDRVDTIAGLTVFRYPPDALQPPAAVVSYPEDGTFDETYGRGSDRMTLPLVVVVGKVSARTTVTRLGAYIDGAGAKSIKAVVESGTYTAFHTVRVVRWESDVARIAGTAYMAAVFTLDVFGQGSP